MNKELARKTFILTGEQKAALFNQYYYSDKPTTEIIKEFGLNGLRPAQITYLFDDVVTDVKCEYCGTLMQHEPPTRSSTEKDLYCPSCGHIVYQNNYEHCNCKGCKEKRNNLIKTYIFKNRDYPKKSLGNLNAWLILILSTLLAYGTDNDGFVIYKNDFRSNFNLFPNEDETTETLEYLINNHFLVLAEYNPDYNFEFKDNNEEINLSHYNPIYYELWLEDDVKDLLQIAWNYDETQKELWHKINKDEALNYLLTIFKKYYIRNYNIDELDQIMDKYVDSFSLLQIFNAIKYVTKQPAQDIALGELSRKSAGYAITKHLKNYYNWLIKNNTEIKEYEINTYNFSLITKFFYFNILKFDRIGNTKIY